MILEALKGLNFVHESVKFHNPNISMLTVTLFRSKELAKVPTMIETNSKAILDLIEASL